MADNIATNNESKTNLTLVHNDAENDVKNPTQKNMTDRVWNQVLKSRENDRARYEKLFG